MQNIKFTDLLGKDFAESNFAVSTNWRIDFSKSEGFKKLLGGDDKVVNQLSFAMHSDYDFTAALTYATAKIKGIPIRQAAWQEREIEGMECAVYEMMDHRVFKALEKATSKVAGFEEHRNISEKEKYTFDGVRLYAYGNSDANADLTPMCSYELIGVQLNNVKSPTYTSGDAAIADVTFELYAHGWRLV